MTRASDRGDQDVRPRNPTAAQTSFHSALSVSRFYPEDGGDVFLRNDSKLLPYYRASHLTRQCLGLVFCTPNFRSHQYWRHSVRVEGSGARIPVGAKFSAHVQTDPGAHPASYIMGTGSFPGVKRPGHDVDHPPYLALKLKSRTGTARPSRK